ncbi:hypothetical protein RBH26_21130 [Natronolimnohabitans sp. A-GB9]|uniref:hypothetical protein n=1 Tax=Natronolimnohabitans sp. A-GB9 TaxID=3069757 RepID=UPI0027B3778B|nr:hypothetical protein [Natronolimnohabitans sp. A-GB9]MDQ2052949.1 hypothetical protein [Natronolimnohabitans sp. A-GB9]
MTDDYADARHADQSLDEDAAQEIAFRKLIYGLAGDEIDPTECGPVEAAQRSVDRVERLEEENEQLRQRVVELRDQVEKMNRAAEFYQDVARKSAAKRDRQAAIVLKHAANVTASGAGRQEYDGSRIQDVLEAANETIHRTNTYAVMEKAEELVDNRDLCRFQKEPRSSSKNTRLIVKSPTDLPETLAGVRIHEGVLSE